jgi:hypothetical protein
MGVSGALGKWKPGGLGMELGATGSSHIPIPSLQTEGKIPEEAFTKMP